MAENPGRFNPYGAQTTTAGGTPTAATQNPYAFKGGIQDRATGWVHFGARWYNPITGTWTQQDTLDAPLDPANANRHAYAGDDPINNLDLLRLYSERSCGIALAAGGVGTVTLLLSVVGGPLVFGLGMVGYALAIAAVADACYD